MGAGSVAGYIARPMVVSSDAGVDDGEGCVLSFSIRKDNIFRLSLSFLTVTLLLSPLLIPLGLRWLVPIIFSISLLTLYFLCVRGWSNLFLILFYGFMLRIYYMVDGGVVFGNDALRDQIYIYTVFREGHLHNFIFRATPNYYKVFPVIPLLSGILKIMSSLSLKWSHYFFLMGIEVFSAVPIYVLARKLVGYRNAYIPMIIYLSIPRLIQWGYMPIPQSLAISLVPLEFLLAYSGLIPSLALIHLAITYTHTPTAMATLILTPVLTIRRGLKSFLATSVFLSIISIVYWMATGLINTEIFPVINRVLAIFWSPTPPPVDVSPVPTNIIIPAKSLLIDFRMPPDLGRLALVTLGLWRLILALSVTIFVFFRKRVREFCAFILIGLILFGLTAAAINYGNISGSRSIERYIATPAYIAFSLSSAVVDGVSGMIFTSLFSFSSFLDPVVGYDLNPAGFRHHLTPSERHSIDILLRYYNNSVVIADYDLGTAYILYKSLLVERELEIDNFQWGDGRGLGYIRLYALRNWYIFSLNTRIVEWIETDLPLVYNNGYVFFTVR